MTKELALKYSEVLKAYGEGKTIQAKSIMDNKWLDTTEPVFDFFRSEYRIKPEPKYIPFTFEDSKLFRDKWIVLKEEHGSSEKLTRIIGICKDHIKHIIGGYITSVQYKDLLRMYTFEDGSPCGKLVE